MSVRKSQNFNTCNNPFKIKKINSKNPSDSNTIQCINIFLYGHVGAFISFRMNYTRLCSRIDAALQQQSSSEGAALLKRLSSKLWMKIISELDVWSIFISLGCSCREFQRLAIQAFSLYDSKCDSQLWNTQIRGS